MNRRLSIELAVAALLLSAATTAPAFDAAGIQAEVLKGRPYSPYAHRAFATNHPDTFSTLIGFEWTSLAAGHNLHRVVGKTGSDPEKGR